jgi:hypothetical protein
MGGNAETANVNAQFVASRVTLSGTADFYLKSDNHNAVPLPGPPVTGLVR